MKFFSTRRENDDITVSFETALLQGFAPDGGLYVPTELPKFSIELIQSWSKLNYSDLATEISSYFITDIPKNELKKLFNETYNNNDNNNIWSDERIVPVIKLGNIYVAELFHGPTLAFKDVAMQMVGKLMDYYLSRRKDRVSVIVATSGDTGPAAISASINKSAIECFVLFPQNKVSERQALQMTTINEPNVHVYEVKNATSDSLDETLRNLFIDRKFVNLSNLCTINSFNLARVMLQTIHYFYSYFQIVPNCDQQIIVALPTGAMGNAAAGMMSILMGLNIKLVLCTNSNDVINEFLTTGIFQKSNHIIPTLSPAIDIQVPYNIERVLYFSCMNSSYVKKWMNEFEKTGKVQIPDKYVNVLKSIMTGRVVSEDDTIEIIRRCYNYHRYIIDPHTAVGLAGIEKAHDTKLLGLPELYTQSPVLCLSTAHPSKFEHAVKSALGHEGLLPQSIQNIILKKHETYANIVSSQELENKLRNDIPFYLNNKQKSRL